MAITITFGTPKPAAARKSTTAATETTVDETVDVVEALHSIFNRRNAILLLAGLSLGIILKQASDIHSMKRTIDILTEVVR